MIMLRVPTRTELQQLQTMMKTTSEEQAYLDSVYAREKDMHKRNAYDERIAFLQQELEDNVPNFDSDGRIAVRRIMIYSLGHALEWKATYEMKDADPIERGHVFLKAIEHYRHADELIGYLTDYSLRRAESSFGAGRFLKQAGDNERAQQLNIEALELLNAFLGGLGGAIVDIVSTANTPEQERKKMTSDLTLTSDKRVEGVAKAYFFKDHTEDGKRN